MSLIDSENTENLPIIFLDNFTNSLFLPTNLSDNLNDISLDNKKENPSKQIKFILTKEETPSFNLLQKKTLPKINEIKSEITNSNGGRWNKDEQKRFAEAVLKYGNDWKQIQNHIYSRNITQVLSHAEKLLMKLKDNNFIKNKGLEQSLSWTKVMNYLRSILTYEELKEVLFSVEQSEDKKILKKKKKLKKSKEFDENDDIIDNSSNCDSNNSDSHFLFEDKEDIYKYNIKKAIIRKEEDEEEILKKYIECFNSPSGEITLNTSFEEESSKENENDIGYKIFNDPSI